MGKRSAFREAIDGNLHKVVTFSGSDDLVYTGDGVLIGFYVNTATSADTAAIKDGSTTVLTIPTGLSAGQFVPAGDIEFLTSLVVSPAATAAGSITVVYQPYPQV